MKETLKKEFSDVLSLKLKNVPVVKEEVEKINFSCYKDVNEKNLMEKEMKQISLVNKVGKNAILNVILLKVFCMRLYWFEK